MTNDAKPAESAELPILQAHDVLEVNVVAPAEGGERLVAVQIARLRIGYAMSVQDALLLAKTLVQACGTASAMNAQDAAADQAPAIILPVRH